MGILGIKNRTENWKTAQTFAPFFGNQPALRLLAGRLGEPLDHEEKVGLELFWKGGRDWIKKKKPDETWLTERLADAYGRYFPDLRCEIVKFHNREPSKNFNSLVDKNYNVSGAHVKQLVSHFKNTEFDIVLETSKHLFIGEAKDESGFGTDGRYVLVHQLIRQCVIAQILVDLVAEDERPPKTVVPFVVAPRCKRRKSLENTAQFRFMTGYPDGKPYLKKSNILSWEELTSPPYVRPPSTE